MGISYEKMYEIHYYECDKNLNCTLESIMNFLGDVGNKHAESLNVGMEYLTERNLTRSCSLDGNSRFLYSLAMVRKTPFTKGFRL